MFLSAHSGIRYLIVLFGVGVIVFALAGLVGKKPFDERFRKLAAAFAGLIHLQLLFGMGVIFTGQFRPSVAGHVVMMVLAAATAQVVPSVMRRRPEEGRTYGPYLVGAIVAMALITGGVMAIGQTLI